MGFNECVSRNSMHNLAIRRFGWYPHARMHLSWSSWGSSWFWASRSHHVGIPWASERHLMGISWACRGHLMGISCASHGHGHLMGISWASNAPSQAQRTLQEARLMATFPSWGYLWPSTRPMEVTWCCLASRHRK